MNWKKFKALPLTHKRQENHYLIGLDLGSDASGLAFYNMATGEAEHIDISGGYGKPSIPTVVQYISETKEWVFGEYAVLNRGSGTEITLNALIARLGHFDYIEIDRRSLSVASVLGLFIKEVLGNVQNINPMADIVGIVASIPAYFSEPSREELTRAFKLAGYEKALIALVPDRECVLAYHYRHAPTSPEDVLLLDFGARELRGGLYHVTPQGEGIHVNSLSSLFNPQVGVDKINHTALTFFEDFVRKEMSGPMSKEKAHQLHEQVTAFAYQHRDLLFQRNIRTKPIKVYFNFTYPPFQQGITHQQVDMLMGSYTLRFSQFIQDVFHKSITPVKPESVAAVLCVGGGFEMLWARECVSNIFQNPSFYKNPKMVTCEGAAILAARMLGVENKQGDITLTDTHQLTQDIGITDGEHFLTLVERNAFWWQSHEPKLVLVNREAVGQVSFHMCTRSVLGEIVNLGDIVLDNVPKRPKGTTRLEIEVNFTSNAGGVIKVRDIGFGDLFPATGMEWVYEFFLKNCTS